MKVQCYGLPWYPDPAGGILFSTDSEGGRVGLEKIGVAVCSSHRKMWYKLDEPVYYVADAAQHYSVIEDDLFRQGPAPRFSSLHAPL
jgi:hypothetical protein